MSRNAVGTIRETEMMPVLFIGHGSPENAIEDNEFTRNWKKIASTIPRPEAILCISAHWIKEGSAITGMEKPRTIHDFYGFPEKLYRVKYDVKGSPEYAKRIKQLVKSVRVELDYEWGLDHGTWSVLVNMYPSLAHPTNDHYLPLLYVIGASETEKPQFLNEGVFAGSVGMRCAIFGAKRDF
jgi:4,5-DOPA dioxygenase extradiol